MSILGDPLPPLIADILCTYPIMGGGEGRDGMWQRNQGNAFKPTGSGGVGLKAVVNVTVTASVEGFRSHTDIGSIRSHATHKCLQLFYAAIKPKYCDVRDFKRQ